MNQLPDAVLQYCLMPLLMLSDRATLTCCSRRTRALANWRNLLDAIGTGDRALRLSLIRADVASGQAILIRGCGYVHVNVIPPAVIAAALAFEAERELSKQAVVS